MSRGALPFISPFIALAHVGLGAGAFSERAPSVPRSAGLTLTPTLTLTPALTRALTLQARRLSRGWLPDGVARGVGGIRASP